MTDVILVINVGSSSIKFALFETQESLHQLLSGVVNKLNKSPSMQVHWVTDERRMERPLPEGAGAEDALDILLKWLLEEAGEFEIVAVGHRIVHGGADYSAPVRVTEDVLAGIARANPAAPSHNPLGLMGIGRVQKHFPDLLQIACFDTHFHQTQPSVESRYALPRRFTDMGIRRYGFHGLSYEFIATELPRHDRAAAKGRTLVAHLGNGASLCALQSGRSIATTMGFTALEGLMMGQRCGNLDPGVVLYLQQELGYSAEQVADILYRQSGLLGVSGITNDMRELLTSDAPEAHEAVELFCHRAVREAGALIALLGGLDALVFTGGMGEKAAPVRQRIAESLAWLGLKLDADMNSANNFCISSEDSAVNVWIIPAEEEQVIARHAWDLLTSSN